MVVLFPYDPNLITVEVIPTFEIVDAPLAPVPPTVDWVEVLRKYLDERKYYSTNG